MFCFCIQHYQRVQYIAYRWCRGNNIFDFFPFRSIVRTRSTIRQLSLEAAAVLSYIAKIVDYVMAAGSSMSGSVRYHLLLSMSLNPMRGNG